MKRYGILQPTATSPAQSPTEPISLEEAKQYVKFIEASPADPAEEALLSTIITAAREHAETEQGRDLVQKQWDLSIDAFLEAEIQLRENLQTVDLVTYKDSAGATTTMTEGTDFITDLVRGTIMPPYNETWPTFDPWPSSAILIRFTCNPPATPAHILTAMKMLIAHWYENRGPLAPAGQQTEMPYAVTKLLEMGSRKSVK